MNTGDIPLLRTADIHNKRVIVRVDFDVPLERGHILDDTRIVGNIPTIKYLLDRGNKLVLIAKLGRPKSRDPEFSLKHIVKVLPDYMPEYDFELIDDFMNETDAQRLWSNPNTVYVLENIRFYPDTVRSSEKFLASLCSLGDVYVNDAFAMSHRDEPSVTGIPRKLPGYAGLLLEKEIHAASKLLHDPKRQFVAIIGGAKMETKVEPIRTLMELCDHVLVGGGIANTFLKAHGFDIADSLCDDSYVEVASEILAKAAQTPTNIMLPIDARVHIPHVHGAHIVPTTHIPPKSSIWDIGPATQDAYEDIIAQAHTILWNGPMGKFEEEGFGWGTDGIYRAVVQNQHAYSVVGGGDTLEALSGKRQKSAISHISTGGGALLELVQKGDLPGLAALRASQSST